MTAAPREFAKRPDAALPATPKAPIEALPPGLVEELAVETSGSTPPEFIQTHISHLLMTADRVYKIRKAVRFPFLSFATRAERNEDCLREVRLNRRLAPDVYLGVARLLRRNGRWHVGAVGEQLSPAEDPAGTPEHCVVMMLERAGPIVDSGRNVILDASFSRAAQRDSVRHWAAGHGIAAQLLEVTCRETVALERLAKREHRGREASDAGLALYRWSVANLQPPTEWPRENLIAIATDDPKWRAGLSSGMH